MPRYRTYLLGIVAALMLGGCATDFTALAIQRNVLEPWSDITGDQAGIPLFCQAGQMSGASYITLLRPAALSARSNDIYVFDAGLGKILRYDRNLKTLTPLATMLSAGAGISIYAAPDNSVYFTDPAQGQVLHFARDGTQFPPLISRGNLARPVSVTMDERNGQILVADGIYGQIVVFNSFGMVLNIIKPQQAITISAMAAAPDGIYVVDHFTKQLVRLGWDGRFRYTFGADVLSEPGSIAVSRDNVVFVSHNFKHDIKVYSAQNANGSRQRAAGENVIPAGKVGCIRAGPEDFNGITGLSVVDDYLFVADSLNARVQIMLINPSAMNVM